MDPLPSKSAADIPDDFKTPLAKIYRALHKNGVTRTQFVNALEDANFSVSGSQLDRWVVNIDKIGGAIKENKISGALPSLDRERLDVASGWVLHENEHGEEVNLTTYHDFVLEFLEVELSNTTIFNYLEEDGFTSRLGKKKGKSFMIDIEVLRQHYWNWVWIQDFRARKIQLALFASIDFTFTGHRTERRSTYAPKGGPQPMLSDRISNFTNCIVTCVWADGVNRTPPMLFTYNGAFREDRNPTKKRSVAVMHLHEAKEKYGIVKERIQYIGNDKNESRTYARECPELLITFFGIYGVDPRCTIYSDNGNSFFEDDSSVLEQLGFKKHVCYPADVHQYISLNDNPLHGSSKQKWRKCRVDFSDDVSSSLALLHYLDEDIKAHSKYWWDRNMISITEEGVESLIGQAPGKLSHLHKFWKRSYEEFMNQNES